MGASILVSRKGHAPCFMIRRSTPLKGISQGQVGVPRECPDGGGSGVWTGDVRGPPGIRAVSYHASGSWRDHQVTQKSDWCHRVSDIWPSDRGAGTSGRLNGISPVPTSTGVQL